PVSVGNAAPLFGTALRSVGSPVITSARDNVEPTAHAELRTAVGGCRPGGGRPGTPTGSSVTLCGRGGQAAGDLGDHLMALVPDALARAAPRGPINLRPVTWWRPDAVADR
ncbi:hypothetical protein ACN3XK_73585, partial [Actinomadura welshii]